MTDKFRAYRMDRRAFLASSAALAIGAAAFPARAQGTKTVEVWLNGSEEKQGVWLASVAEKLRQAYPDIDLRPTVLDWGGASQKIAASAAAGTLPDIFFVYSSDMAAYAQGGALLPLDGLVDKSGFIDAGVQIGTWDGKWYGAPAGMDAPTYVYRKDFAAAAGLDPESPPQTWDELAQWSRALTVRGASGQLERAGFWLATGHPWVTFNQFMAMLYTNAGTLFSADGMKSNLTSDAAIETATFLSGLINVDKVIEPGLVQAENRDFAEGRIASLISPIAVRGWAENYPDINNLDTVGFAAVPAGPKGKKGGVVAGGGLFLVSANTADAEATAKVLSALTLDPVSVAELNSFDASPPPLKADLIGDYFTRFPMAEQYHELIEEYPRFYPQHPSFGAMFASFNRALDNIYLTGADPSAAFSEAAKELDGIIERSGIAVEESQG